MSSKEYKPMAVYGQRHFYKVEDLGNAVKSAIFYINNPKKSLDCTNLKKALSSSYSCDNNLSDTNILKVDIMEKEKNRAKVKIDFSLDQHHAQFYQHLRNHDDSLLKFSQNGLADWIPGDINSVKAYTTDSDFSFDTKATTSSFSKKNTQQIIGPEQIQAKIKELTENFSSKSVEDIEKIFCDIFPNSNIKVSIKDGLMFVFAVFVTLFEAKNAEWLTNLFNILLKVENLPLLKSTSGIDPCLQLIFIIIGVLQWTAFDQLAQSDKEFDTVLGANKQDCLSHVEKIEKDLDAVFLLMQTKPIFFKQKKYTKIHASLDQLLNSLRDFMEFLKDVSMKLHEHLKNLQKQKACWTAAYVAAICTAVGLLAYGAMNIGLLFKKKLLLGGVFAAGKLASEIDLLREGLKVTIDRQSKILDQINNFHLNIQEMETKLTGKSLNQMSGMKEEMTILAKEFKIACGNIRQVFEGKSRN
ncbi:6516_t:CDS:10 [Ambispora gerdemannii]|uniref:6516_t:CDS:1 n=1 Tax=Ambispora gerdemannii TaxID=144530 RepID=A0A9N9BRJ0_9GLOM|nr:6516_t:CDS:10 [Ambispora gerdemannii]